MDVLKYCIFVTDYLMNFKSDIYGFRYNLENAVINVYSLSEFTFLTFTNWKGFLKFSKDISPVNRNWEIENNLLHFNVLRLNGVQCFMDFFFGDSIKFIDGILYVGDNSVAIRDGNIVMCNGKSLFRCSGSKMLWLARNSVIVWRSKSGVNLGVELRGYDSVSDFSIKCLFLFDSKMNKLLDVVVNANPEYVLNNIDFIYSSNSQAKFFLSDKAYVYNGYFNNMLI